MKLIHILLFSAAASSCNLLEQTPGTYREVNNTNNSNNGTLLQTIGTTGTIPGELVELPFSKWIASKRSEKGLVARWDFKESDEGFLEDRSPAAKLSLVSIGNVEKVSDRNGVRFSGGRLVHEKAEFLQSEIVGTSAFTIEMWIQPSVDDFETGTIITMSGGPDRRNFTITQRDAAVHLRLRTDDASIEFDRFNGIDEFVIPGVFSKITQHIVLTYDGNVGEFWVDGLKKGTMPLPGGLREWEPSFALQFGQEIGGFDTWLGEIYYAAIYNRALSAEEIKHHFSLGSRSDPEIAQDTSSIFVDRCETWPFDLLNTEDFTAFYNAGCSRVSGNVIIEGGSAGDLSYLNKLEYIGGDLRITGSDFRTLEGLGNLVNVAGSIRIVKNPRLIDFEALNALSSVGADVVVVDNEALEDLDQLEVLLEVPGNLIVKNNENLSDLSGLGEIKKIGGTLLLDQLADIRDIEYLPALREVKEISISRMPADQIIFPNINLVDTIWIRELDQLKNFMCPAKANNYHFYQNNSLPQLSFLEIGGQTSLFIAHNPSLLRIGLTRVTKMKDLNIQNTPLIELDFDALRMVRSLEMVGLNDLLSMDRVFPELIQVGGDIIIWKNNQLSTMDGAFPKLRTSGYFSIRYNGALLNVSQGFSMLQTVNGFVVKDNLSLPQCDVDILLSRINNVGVLLEGGNSGLNNCR